MTKKLNLETEEKIKQAAKEIFLQKGYDWSRTREITEKAWVNLALLNYYFWWKKELFNIIMFELLEDFRDSMFLLLNDKNTSFNEKIRGFCDSYFDNNITNIKVLPFILDNIRANIKTVQEKIIEDNNIFSKTVFAEQYMQKTWKWINEFKEFFINFMWLITFPIIWAPILTTFFELNEKQYLEYLKKRKELILKIVPNII